MNNRSTASYEGEVKAIQSATFDVDIKNYHALPQHTSGAPCRMGNPRLGVQCANCERWYRTYDDFKF